MSLIEDFAEELEARCISTRRQRDHLRLLRQLDASLAPRSLTEATGEDLTAYLALRRETGCAAGTLRKERQMALSFFAWAHRTGKVGGDTLIAMRSTASSLCASDRARPRPYSSRELASFREALDRRWPLLSNRDDARRSVERCRAGKSPYSRIRKHAIRLQLDALISIALHGGLRRRELLALTVDDMHYDNAYVVVWSGERFKSAAREVPFTETARASVTAWLDFRAAMGADHDRPWLNLWAARTALEPIGPDAFAKLPVSYVASALSYRRLRDTCAVGWLEAGMSLWQVQRLLGHARLKDTLPYGEAVAVDLQAQIGTLGTPSLVL